MSNINNIEATEFQQVQRIITLQRSLQEFTQFLTPKIKK